MTVATRESLQASFLIESDGSLSDSDRVQDLRAVAAPVLLGSSEVLLAMESFGLAAGMQPLQVDDLGRWGGENGPNGAGGIECGAAVVSLVASYVGPGACAVTFGITCAFALIGHTASVIGLSSCF